MAWQRVFQTGFETGSTWEFPSRERHLPSLSSSGARTGSWRFRQQTSAGSVGYFFPNSVHVRAGAYVKTSTMIIWSEDLFRVYSRDYGWVARINLPSTEVLTVKDLSGDVASIGLWEAGLGIRREWVHMAFLVKAGASGYFKMFINGIETLSHSPLLLTGGVGNPPHFNEASFFDIVQSGYGWRAEIGVDDVYIDVGDGTEPVEPPPSPSFHWISPASVSGTPQWTPVGDVDNRSTVEGVPLDEDSFNVSDAGGELDMFSMDSISVGADEHVNAVIPTGFLRKGISAFNLNAHFVIDDGINQDVSPGLAPTYGWSVLNHRFTTQADGVSAWTDTDASNHTYGIESEV